MNSWIESVNVGQSKLYNHGRKRISSAIDKRQVDGPVQILKDGLVGDEQAERSVHGGADKAVHAYPCSHYPYWRERLDGVLPYGSFGENLSISGVDETQISIGDTIKAGSVLMQVSEPRQPCYKLAMRFVQPKLPLWFREQGYTGFYLRVLQEGELRQGDVFHLVKRAQEAVTVHAAYMASYDKNADWEQRVREALHSRELGEDWRRLLEQRLHPSSR